MPFSRLRQATVETICQLNGSRPQDCLHVGLLVTKELSQRLLLRRTVTGSKDSSVIQRPTRDPKVSGSSPGNSGERFFLWSTFFANSVFVPAPCYHNSNNNNNNNNNNKIYKRYPGHSAKGADGRLQLNMRAPCVCGFE